MMSLCRVGWLLALLRPPLALAEPQAEPAPLLLPTAEILGLYTGFAGTNRLLFQEEWTQVTPETVLRNAHASWVIDKDDFAINQLGHPYQGSLYFTAARSSGFGFWQSFLFGTAGSLLWEIAGETEPPSLNDQITTTFAGALFGEALYRTWNALIESDGPLILRHAVAAVLAPVASFNRYVFGRKSDLAARMLYSRLWLGSSYGGSVRDQTGARTELLGFGQQVSFGVGLTHGFPTPGEKRGYAPFDHFDLKLEVSIPNVPYVALFTRGLVLGTNFKSGQWLNGAAGLFGSYDYTTLPLLRVSSSAVGPGAAARIDFGEGVTLQTTAIVSLIFFGGAGAVTEASGDRDFRAGAGAQSLVEARLLLRDSGSLTAGVRNYFIRGYPRAPGTEFISYGWLGAELRVVDHHAVGMEVQVSGRNATEPAHPDVSHAGSLFRVYYAFVSDVFFGVGRSVDPAD